jgi:hypothetical protein
LQTPRRIEVQGRGALHVLAGVNQTGTGAAILVSNLGQDASELKITCAGLPWTGVLRGHVRAVDSTHNFDQLPGTLFEANAVRFTLRGSAVALVVLRR